MVGEFTHKNGTDYVMVVNLSQEKPTKITVTTTMPSITMEFLSAQNGQYYPMNYGQWAENGNVHWLVPGQGILIRLSAAAKDNVESNTGK